MSTGCHSSLTAAGGLRRPVDQGQTSAGMASRRLRARAPPVAPEAGSARRAQDLVAIRRPKSGANKSHVIGVTGGSARPLVALLLLCLLQCRSGPGSGEAQVVVGHIKSDAANAAAAAASLLVARGLQDSLEAAAPELLEANLPRHHYRLVLEQLAWPAEGAPKPSNHRMEASGADEPAEASNSWLPVREPAASQRHAASLRPDEAPTIAEPAVWAAPGQQPAQRRNFGDRQPAESPQPPQPSASGANTAPNKSPGADYLSRLLKYRLPRSNQILNAWAHKFQQPTAAPGAEPLSANASNKDYLVVQAQTKPGSAPQIEAVIRVGRPAAAAAAAGARRAQSSQSHLDELEVRRRDEASARAAHRKQEAAAGWLKEVEHARHGWKNVYHREELTDRNRYRDKIRDRSSVAGAAGSQSRGDNPASGSPDIVGGHTKYDFTSGDGWRRQEQDEFQPEPDSDSADGGGPPEPAGRLAAAASPHVTAEHASPESPPAEEQEPQEEEEEPAEDPGMERIRAKLERLSSLTLERPMILVRNRSAHASHSHRFNGSLLPEEELEDWRATEAARPSAWSRAAARKAPGSVSTSLLFKNGSQPGDALEEALEEPEEAEQEAGGSPPELLDLASAQRRKVPKNGEQIRLKLELDLGKSLTASQSGDDRGQQNGALRYRASGNSSAGAPPVGRAFNYSQPLAVARPAKGLEPSQPRGLPLAAQRGAPRGRRVPTAAAAHALQIVGLAPDARQPVAVRPSVGRPHPKEWSHQSAAFYHEKPSSSASTLAAHEPDLAPFSRAAARRPMSPPWHFRPANHSSWPNRGRPGEPFSGGQRPPLDTRPSYAVEQARFRPGSYLEWPANVTRRPPAGQRFLAHGTPLQTLERPAALALHSFEAPRAEEPAPDSSLDQFGAELISIPGASMEPEPAGYLGEQMSTSEGRHEYLLPAGSSLASERSPLSRPPVRFRGLALGGPEVFAGHPTLELPFLYADEAGEATKAQLSQSQAPAHSYADLDSYLAEPDMELASEEALPAPRQRPPPPPLLLASASGAEPHLVPLGYLPGQGQLVGAPLTSPLRGLNYATDLLVGPGASSQLALSVLPAVQHTFGRLLRIPARVLGPHLAAAVGARQQQLGAAHLQRLYRPHPAGLLGPSARWRQLAAPGRPTRALAVVEAPAAAAWRQTPDRLGQTGVGGNPSKPANSGPPAAAAAAAAAAAKRSPVRAPLPAVGRTAFRLSEQQQQPPPPPPLKMLPQSSVGAASPTKQPQSGTAKQTSERIKAEKNTSAWNGNFNQTSWSAPIAAFGLAKARQPTMGAQQTAQAATPLVGQPLPAVADAPPSSSSSSSSTKAPNFGQKIIATFKSKLHSTTGGR